MATSFKDVGKEDVRALKDAVEKVKTPKRRIFKKKRIPKEYLVKISENCELGTAFIYTFQCFECLGVKNKSNKM